MVPLVYCHNNATLHAVTSDGSLQPMSQPRTLQGADKSEDHSCLGDGMGIFSRQLSCGEKFMTTPLLVGR